MRKVVFLTTIPSPYRVAFFNEWGKYCNLTVLFEKRASSDRSDIWKQINIQNFTSIFLHGISVKANKAFCPEVLKYLKKLEYDVFVIGGYNTPTAMLASIWLKRHKVPYILNADGGYIKKETFFIEQIKKNFISNANMWICTSDKAIDYFLHYGATGERIYKYPFTSIQEKNVLERPLNIEEKKRIREEIGITEKIVILSVGQFIYRKGFDILLNSVKDLGSDVGIYLIGGKVSLEYQDIVDKHKLNTVHFLDFMKSEDLAYYYKSADIFVFPTREDIWGLVINEAAAYGLPIITTTECIAGLEMVSDLNGRLVKSNDENELNKAIKEVLSSSKLKENMALKSLEIAKEFTIEKMVNRHMEIVEEFVDLYG